MPGSRRFSQAISEGDGISVIVPVNSAERDGPHIGTSMAAFTQSIQLAESR